MNARNVVLALFVGVWSLWASTARADLINGDFQTGDLTGWTATAMDRFGNPTTPLISVATAGSNSFAVFKTGTFAGGPFISTLQQSFTVEAAKPFLRFDFTLPTITPDATGTGTSPFRDALTVSIGSGTSTFTLLLLDKNGALADPFGTAPGTVALGAPLQSGFNFGFNADLSMLQGQTVTLFFDVINENDGFQFASPTVDLVRTEAPYPERIPEPGSLVLLALGTFGLLGYAWRQRKRAA